MRSGIPKDGAPSPADDLLGRSGVRSGTDSPFLRDEDDASREFLVEPDNEDGILENNDPDDADGSIGHAFLMPHERKLPRAEQRRILAMRRTNGDGIIDDDDDELEGFTTPGRRPGRRAQTQRTQDDPQSTLRTPLRSDSDSESGTSGTGTSGGVRIEKIDPTVATAASAQTARADTGTATDGNNASGNNSTGGGIRIEKVDPTVAANANAQNAARFDPNKTTTDTSGNNASGNNSTGGGIRIEKVDPTVAANANAQNAARFDPNKT
ncbi:MAG: hypothetical protein ACOY82_10085, partial [Pseudomonadota bacterium]